MMQMIEMVWSEGAADGSWSIGLTKQGTFMLHLGAGHKWSASPDHLWADLPEEVFDALVKHKGETRRYLQGLKA